MAQEDIQSIRLPFRDALKTQFRVLYALLLRESSLHMGPHRFGHLLVVTEVI